MVLDSDEESPGTSKATGREYQLALTETQAFQRLRQAHEDWLLAAAAKRRKLVNDDQVSGQLAELTSALTIEDTPDGTSLQAVSGSHSLCAAQCQNRRHLPKQVARDSSFLATTPSERKTLHQNGIRLRQ